MKKQIWPTYEYDRPRKEIERDLHNLKRERKRLIKECKRDGISFEDIKLALKGKEIEVI